MDPKELNRNGGCKAVNTGIIIVWKTTTAIVTGCFGWVIMMMTHINGLFMDSFLKVDEE